METGFYQGPDNSYILEKMSDLDEKIGNINERLDGLDIGLRDFRELLDEINQRLRRIEEDIECQ